MNIPLDDSGKPQDSLYLPTDISPEEVFQAIGRLRKEARDEIDRLIRFLDKTDDYVSRELEDDDSCLLEDGGDTEPSLGSFDRMTDQSKAWRQGHLWVPPEVDAEQDDADAEPSLGSLACNASSAGWQDGPNPTGNQEQWAAGDRRDLEDEHDGAEPDESGIGDRDGLLEQVGSQDWQRGGMV